MAFCKVGEDIWDNRVFICYIQCVKIKKMNILSLYVKIIFFTIPFQEDEFVEYINNEKKLLNFSIGVEFITKKNNIGLYIVENDE